LQNPDQEIVGNGRLLFFLVDDFDTSWKRALSLGTSIEEYPHFNPYARHQEFNLRDLMGIILICSNRDEN
jgi:hypothetical protein